MNPLIKKFFKDDDTLKEEYRKYFHYIDAKKLQEDKMYMEVNAAIGKLQEDDMLKNFECYEHVWMLYDYLIDHKESLK